MNYGSTHSTQDGRPQTIIAQLYLKRLMTQQPSYDYGVEQSYSTHMQTSV
jgi:hypothetical protein